MSAAEWISEQERIFTSTACDTFRDRYEWSELRSLVGCDQVWWRLWERDEVGLTASTRLFSQRLDSVSFYCGIARAMNRYKACHLRRRQHDVIPNDCRKGKNANNYRTETEASANPYNIPNGRCCGWGWGRHASDTMRKKKEYGWKSHEMSSSWALHLCRWLQKLGGATRPCLIWRSEWKREAGSGINAL